MNKGKQAMAQIDTKQFDTKLQKELDRVGLFSINKILLMSNEEFFEVGNFTIKDINTLKDAAARSICSGFRKVLDIEDHLKKKWRTLTFDCCEIDEILGGGIPTRGITELSGESAAGKTQFCLQYSITVQYSVEEGGLGSRAVYICTEDRFPSSRLNQLMQHFPRSPTIKKPESPNTFSDNIYIMHIATVESLKECLYSQLPTLLEKTKIGLLVIDSIAAVFRSDYSVSQSVSRAQDLREIGVQLHKIAKHFRIVVICVNQISDAVDQGIKIPALGLAWANLVTTKIQLRLSPNRQRSFHLLSAPHLPPRSIPYRIEASGIVPDI